MRPCRGPDPKRRCRRRQQPRFTAPLAPREQQLPIQHPSFGEPGLAVGEVQGPESPEALVEAAKCGDRGPVALQALAPGPQRGRVMGGDVVDGDASQLGGAGACVEDRLERWRTTTWKDPLVEERSRVAIDPEQPVVSGDRL